MVTERLQDTIDWLIDGARSRIERGGALAGYARPQRVFGLRDESEDA